MLVFDSIDLEHARRANKGVASIAEFDAFALN